MTLSWKQVKVHVRTSLIVVVAVVIAIVLFKNRNNTVSFWFFGLTDPEKKINVVHLIVSTAAATRLSWWVFSLGWGIWSDMKDLRVEQAKEREKLATQSREARLSEMERRIDNREDQHNDPDVETTATENVDKPANTDVENTDSPRQQ